MGTDTQILVQTLRVCGFGGWQGLIGFSIEEVRVGLSFASLELTAPCGNSL